MKIRHFTERDSDRVLALWNRSSRFDPLTPELFEAMIWDQESHHEKLVLVVEHESRVYAFSAAGLVQRAGVTAAAMKMLVVDAAVRRKGLATRLMHLMSQSAVEVGASRMLIGGEGMLNCMAGIDPRYSEALMLAESLGYARAGEVFDIQLDNYAAPIDAPPVRHAKESDLSAIHRLSGISLDALPDHCFVIEDGGEIVAAALQDDRYPGLPVVRGCWAKTSPQAQARREALAHALLQAMKNGGRSCCVMGAGDSVSFWCRRINGKITRTFFIYEKKLDEN